MYTHTHTHTHREADRDRGKQQTDSQPAAPTGKTGQYEWLAPNALHQPHPHQGEEEVDAGCHGRQPDGRVLVVDARHFDDGGTVVPADKDRGEALHFAYLQTQHMHAVMHPPPHTHTHTPPPTRTLTPVSPPPPPHTHPVYMQLYTHKCILQCERIVCLI